MWKEYNTTQQCYYFDEKYSPRHKFKEPKFFQIDTSENNSVDEAIAIEVTEEEEGEPLMTQNIDTPTTPDELVISLHALVNISSPQTLKIWCSIKHQLVVVLIDSGSMHNFVQKIVVEVVHCFVRAVSIFQDLISNGGDHEMWRPLWKY